MNLLLIVLGIRVEKYYSGPVKILWFEILHLFYGLHLLIIKGEEHTIKFGTVYTFNHEGPPIKVTLEHLLQLVVRMKKV